MPETHFAGRQLLLLDDERSIADTLAVILAQHGFQVRVAYSAEDAIRLIEHWAPELAILDIWLPKMNGIDFAMLLRAACPDCRILLFSGQPASAQLLEQAAGKGHRFEIAAKPLHPTELLKRIEQLLAADSSASA